MKRLIPSILVGCAFLAGCPLALAQPPNMAPPKVVVDRSREGVLSPQAEYKGSVYFKEVSSVASEVSGKVLAVEFEEGFVVHKGDVLVRLDDELLQKDLESAKANVARRQAELKDAQVRYERAKTLVSEGLGTPEAYDEIRFQVESLSNQLWSARAEMERLQTIITRYAIKAPFDGVVIDRMTEHGEWKQSGSAVALLAREHAYEVLVDVPEDYLRFLQPGVRIAVTVGSDALEGVVTVVIPRGDIATRTFPVKIAVDRDTLLFEGMTAIVQLPIGDETACLFVPRDAILRDQGDEYIFTVEGDTVHRHDVDVLGYKGMEAGIAEGVLSLDAPVIVKGHERLRDGQRVEVVAGISAPSAPQHSDD